MSSTASTVSRASSARRAMLGLSLIIIAACAFNADITITTPIGTAVDIHIEGTIPAIPPGWTPLNITSFYEGAEYELFDGNGDGLIDAARKVGATSAFRISPTPIPEPTQDLASHPIPGTPITPITRTLDRSFGLFYAKSCEQPIDFVATGSASQLLLEHGFDGQGFPPSTIQNMFEVNRARIGLDRFGEINSIYLDVTVHWDGRFAWPLEVEEFPKLGYNFHNLTDVPGVMGQYWFLQTDGPAESVLSWLSRFGISEVVSPLVVLSQPGQSDTVLHDMVLSIDAVNEQAHASIEGLHALSLDLD